jgi:CelD/BcsL family acetyltransferase involved in cellulose biosynthesis
MAAAGWLRIPILALNGTPIAFDIALCYQNCYWMLKTSYDSSAEELSPGVVLRWLVVKELIASGCREHDFMWGIEPYKLQWADNRRRFNRLTIFNTHLRPRTILLLRKLMALVRKPPKATEKASRMEEPTAE